MVKQPERIEKIPRHAEETFAMLCAARGVTCNKATEDERGWDYFVQFPNRLALGVPLDMQPPADKCFVQIKSIAGNSDDVRVKVSNALEFSVSEAPCFVIVLTYQNGRQSTFAYVVHFWKDEIERTLKRVRALDAKGRRNLNRFWMHLRVSAAMKVELENLVDHLEGVIRKFERRYSDAKREVAEKVGFEEADFLGHVTFKAGVTVDDVIDLQLGLKDTLEVSEVSARSVRFGIAARTPTVHQVAGRISMRSHPKDCVVELSSEKSPREVALPSSLYVPGIRDLPKEKWRFRILNDYLELTATFGTALGKFKIGWNSEDRRLLPQIGLMLDLLHIISTGNLHFRVRDGSSPFLGGTASIEGFHIAPATSAIDCFVKFLLRGGSTTVPNDLLISLNDLHERAYEVGYFNALVKQRSIDATGVFSWQGDEYSGPAKALYSASAQLPTHTAYAIVTRSCVIHGESQGRTSVTLGDVDHTRIRILAGTFETTADVIYREMDARSTRMDTKPVLVLPPSFMRAQAKG